MKDWAYHYHKAELYLEQATRQYISEEDRRNGLIAAQAHAILASCKYETPVEVPWKDS